MEALHALFDYLSQNEVFMDVIGGFLIGTAALRGIQFLAEVGIKATASKADDHWWAKKVVPVLNVVYQASGFLNSWKKPPTL